MATAYGSSAESKSLRSRLPSTTAAMSNSSETTVPARVPRAETDPPAGGRLPAPGDSAGRGGADGGGGGSAARTSEGSDTAPR